MDVDNLKGLLEELCSLEVNTIIKSNMTAGKMPSTAAALVDIVTEYAVKLRHLTARTPTRAIGGEVSLASFEEIRKLSADYIASREPPPKGRGAGDVEPSAWEKPDAEEEADLLMLCRLRDNSEQLKAIWKDNESLSWNRVRAEEKEVTAAMLALKETQKLLIRKVWEVGTEEVAMQTVIYLDGDVITRLQPEYYQDSEKRAVIPIHNKAVETSIAFWSNLVKLAETFVATVLGKKD